MNLPLRDTRRIESGVCGPSVLTHPPSIVHRFGGGGDLFDRVRDVTCQIDRVGNDPLSVCRSRKQQAAHEAEDKFVFHEDWGGKGNEEIK